MDFEEKDLSTTDLRGHLPPLPRRKQEDTEEKQDSLVTPPD